MPIPDPKVEVGFDLTDSPIAPFFQLDDSVKGRLDNTEYRLAGTIFYDVTDRVRTIDIRRGKAQIFTEFPAGEADVEFDNNDRAFDPRNPDSPFFGQIIPRRELKISANDVVQFQGFIEDWDLSYTSDNNSTANALASDVTAWFSSQFLDGFSPPEEYTGERINRVLDLPGVNWPVAQRNIETGEQLLGAYPAEDGQDVLTYLNNMAASEPGSLFITKEGHVSFRDRITAPTSADLVTFGEGGLPFDNVRVIYGSENLYNTITLTRNTGGTVTAVDQASIDEYGVRELTIENMHVADDADLVPIAVEYASRYSQPEYRFEAFDVYLEKLSEADQDKVLGLEIGSVCLVRFTPNQIGDPIEQYVEVIRIEQSVNVVSHVVSLGFSEIRYAPLVLDDAVFGKLDVGTLSW